MDVKNFVEVKSKDEKDREYKKLLTPVLLDEESYTGFGSTGNRK